MNGAHRRERERRLDALLHEASLDAVVVHGRGVVGEHGAFSWLTGHVPDHRGAWAVRTRGGVTMLFIPAGGPLPPPGSGAPPVTVLQDGDHGRRPIRDLLPSGARIGVAGVDAAGAVRDDPVAPIDIGDAISELVRLVDDDLVESLRAHGATIARALDAARSAIGPGRTERDVAGTAAAELARGGSALQILHVSVDCFTGGRPSDRIVRSDSLVTVFVESATPTGGWLEAGFALALDAADAEGRRLVASADSALRAGVLAVVPGRTLGDVADAMRRELGGYGEPTIGLGHSTGWDQGPHIVVAESRHVIREGDALCLHPSAIAGDGRSVGVAATMLVNAGGAENIVSAQQYS